MENKKKAPYLETVLISLGVILFLTISGLLIFQRELVDDFFGRTKSNNVVEDVVIVDEDVDFEEVEVDEEVIEYVGLRLEDGLLYANFENSYNLAGMEISFQKSEGLEITDFTCSDPFQCLDLKSEEDTITIGITVPVTYEDELSGEVELGEFVYTGSGSLSLDINDSMVVSIDDIKLMFNDVDLVF